MRRSVDDDDAPLDVFGASDAFDQSPVDVSFGRRTPKPPSPGPPRVSHKRRVNPWIAGVGVVSLVAAAFVFGDPSAQHRASPPSTSALPNRRAHSSSPPAPSSAAIAASPTATPSSSPASTSTVSAAETTTTVPSLGPLYANSSGLGLFLVSSDSFGSSQLHRIDLQTGTFEPVQLRSLSNSSQIVGVAPADGGVVPIVASYENGQADTAPAPDGTVWLLGGTDPTLRRVRYHVDGTYVVMATVPGIRSTDAIALLGSTADLRPVILLQDGRGYDVAPDTGGLRRITDGSPTRFERGYFGETVCSQDGACVLRIHGNGPPHDIPSPVGFVRTSFSPDGRTVLIASQASGGPGGVTSTLIDLGSGSAEPVTMLTQNFYGGNNIAWTPDSSSFFWVESGGSSLSMLEVASRVVIRYDISTQLGSDSVQSLAGLA